MAGGGQIIPALQSGALQFGISDALGVLNARNGGIPATYVSFNFSQSSADPVHAVLTMDPEIKTPADLKGKSVATNLSYNTDWTMMREWLRKEKVDLQSITFREIPFPDMLAGLRNKTVSAVGATEPFITLGKEQGAHVLGYYFTDVKSPVVLSGIVAMVPYAEANPDIVKRFVKAINHAIEDFRADPQVRSQDDCREYQDSSRGHREDGSRQLADRCSAGADAVLGRCSQEGRHPECDDRPEIAGVAAQVNVAKNLASDLGK